MPRKRRSKLQAHRALQPSAPSLPTSSAAGGNLPLLHGASHAASEARPRPSWGSSSSSEGITADVVSIAPTLSAQAGPQLSGMAPQAAPVTTVWPHLSFPKLFPSVQGSGAPSDQTKQGPRPWLPVKELESVLEDSEGSAGNQLPSAEEKSDTAGPSEMHTTKRSLAGPPGNSDDDFEGPSKTSLPVETGNVVKMLADSTSFSSRLKHRRGARIGPYSSAKDDRVPIQHTVAQKGADVPDWKENSSCLEEEELFPQDVDCDSSFPETRATSVLASDASDWLPSGLALEYLLTPLSTLKKYSSQNFNQQVENYFKRA